MCCCTSWYQQFLQLNKIHTACKLLLKVDLKWFVSGSLNLHTGQGALWPDLLFKVTVKGSCWKLSQTSTDIQNDHKETKSNYRDAEWQQNYYRETKQPQRQIWRETKQPQTDHRDTTWSYKITIKRCKTNRHTTSLETKDLQDIENNYKEIQLRTV